MKRLGAAIAMAAAVVIIGCASTHTITLLDGSIIESNAEPEFDKKTGFYEFETRAGEYVKLNKDQVRSIRRVDR
jgi:major membrane immunogen (membrane-anchored lipoprotein)